MPLNDIVKVPFGRRLVARTFCENDNIVGAYIPPRSAIPSAMYHARPAEHLER
jgi:hypothetical protein